jgi:hypothetical protein
LLYPAELWDLETGKNMWFFHFARKNRVFPGCLQGILEKAIRMCDIHNHQYLRFVELKSSQHPAINPKSVAFQFNLLFIVK